MQIAMTHKTNATIQVDITETLGELRPIWRFFGYDEPNYTYMKDGQKLLSQLAALSRDTVFVRAHNLLTTGDGTPALKWGSTNAYTEDADGNPIYDWTIVDRIFEAYLERGLKPYVQIGFMPEALSTHPQPYQHEWAPDKKNSISTGWAYPPTDYAKWGELVYQWTKHCVEKYGCAEVESWYWEVWNEPDIFYWRGTPDEYNYLYDFAVDGVRRALPTARVGGPEVARTNNPEAAQYLRGFLEHCLRGKNYATGETGAPLDFIAFHAKGAPKLIDGHVQMGLAEQLQEIDRSFGIIASYPQLKHLPIVIGESDPDGCAACPATVFPQNGYRNGALFASYTAAAFARKFELADKHGVNFEGALTWAFEFEDQPYFAGFRVLASNGIGLPVLNVFRMFGEMRGQRLQVRSSAGLSVEAITANGVQGAPDIHALASLYDKSIWVMVWHYHDDALPAPPAAVELVLKGLPVGNTPALLHHYRIDDAHSNSFEAWNRMGCPPAPTTAQYAELEQASHLALLGSPEWVQVIDGEVRLRFDLPRQGVSLLRLDA